MKELSRNEKLAYLIGLFDGEGCLGISIERDSRKCFVSEAGGWRITPHIQITNSDKVLTEIITKFLRQIGYQPRIHQYATGYVHVRLHRLDEVERFAREAIRYSNGDKRNHISIFLQEVIPLFHSRPLLFTNGKMKTWTRDLFIRAVTAIDKIDRYKRVRRITRKYNREFFVKLWKQN